MNYDLTGGNPQKPYPIEGNFVRNDDPSIGDFEGTTVTQMEEGNVANQFGQVKYARREGAISIYKDKSRETENDAAASAKAEGSTIYEDADESEESQGI